MVKNKFKTILGKVISENVKNDFRNELESYKQEITGIIRFLHAKLGDAEIKIAGLEEKNGLLEKRVNQLENKTETQELTIKELERDLHEKIVECELQRNSRQSSTPGEIFVENEMYSMTLDNNRVQDPISKSPQPETFGLTDDQLNSLAHEYGSV